VQRRWTLKEVRVSGTSQSGETIAGKAVALYVAALVVAIDQITKSLAVANLQAGPIHIFGPFYFRLEFNSGFAFSLATGYGSIIGVVAVVVATALLFYSAKTESLWFKVALGLVAGGALGNVSDRVFRGHGGAVVDFIYSGFWPTFNLADASIVTGAVLIAIISIRSERSSRRSQLGS
jgi:signal peptidase II